jgi:hypothetical protein
MRNEGRLQRLDQNRVINCFGGAETWIDRETANGYGQHGRQGCGLAEQVEVKDALRTIASGVGVVVAHRSNQGIGKT